MTEFLGFVKYSFTHKVLLFHWLFFGHFVLTLYYKHTTNARAIGFISVLVVSLNFFFFLKNANKIQYTHFNWQLKWIACRKCYTFFSLFIYLFIRMAIMVVRVYSAPNNNLLSAKQIN